MLIKRILIHSSCSLFTLVVLCWLPGFHCAVGLEPPTAADALASLASKAHLPHLQQQTIDTVTEEEIGKAIPASSLPKPTNETVTLRPPLLYLSAWVEDYFDALLCVEGNCFFKQLAYSWHHNDRDYQSVFATVSFSHPLQKILAVHITVNFICDNIAKISTRISIPQ